jgi:hypothetical protein
MEDDFELVFENDGEYEFSTIPEVVCRLLCTVVDHGDRHSPSSRYIYSFKNHTKSKQGFQFGTAKACVQSYILSKNKQGSNLSVQVVTKESSDIKFKAVCPELVHQSLREHCGIHKCRKCGKVL